MKLKMSENSLFAVLLRAPWWISFVVMLVFALAASALLPREYVPFGVMGAFPFLVIGVIASWRQWHAPSRASMEQMLISASSMSWREFADTVENTCKLKGYEVTRLNSAAADFSLSKNGRTTLLNAKRWKAANLGVETVRDMAKAIAAQQANDGLFLSVQPVTDAAQRLAKSEGIILLSADALALWLISR